MLLSQRSLLHHGNHGLTIKLSHPALGVIRALYLSQQGRPLPPEHGYPAVELIDLRLDRCSLGVFDFHCLHSVCAMKWMQHAG